MKTLFLALSVFTTLVAPAAFASPDTSFYCHGIRGSEGKTFYAKLLNSDAIREGDKMEFLLVIRDGSETLFAGHVNGSSEDVMLSFKSKRGGPKLSAMIYMDEYDQTWAKLGNQEMSFDCSSKEE